MAIPSACLQAHKKCQVEHSDITRLTDGHRLIIFTPSARTCTFKYAIVQASSTMLLTVIDSDCCEVAYVKMIQNVIPVEISMLLVRHCRAPLSAVTTCSWNQKNSRASDSVILLIILVSIRIDLSSDGCGCFLMSIYMPKRNSFLFIESIADGEWGGAKLTAASG